MQRIRVLVVDDHRIFAESLAAALAAEQDVEVAAAGSGPAALRSIERGNAEGRRFDVVLVDADLGSPAQPQSAHAAQQHAAQPQHARVQPAQLPQVPQAHAAHPHERMPGPAPAPAPVSRGNGDMTAGLAVADGSSAEHPAVGGIALVSRVRQEHPQLRTVVLAERDDPRHAAAALQAGAGGWVAKDCSLSRLLQVIRGVLKDETHLSPSLLTGVLRELTASRKHRTESERLVESLTPREREVLRCMVAGLGRKAVAERLYLSPHTVRTHMQNVLGKLGVHSTLAAVALARRAGVGPVELEPSTAVAQAR
ncbi:LuxR C-terminal-related transcriptional regulator [Streptomyces sp. ODS28]|uniref:LuxR C-terminal-related transcriptional regulator n=1 Tax=Streptomyces sp. ODS28 TaxID=3136688 RepID=UPI0031EC9191